MNNLKEYIFEKLKINKDVNNSSKLDYDKIYNIIHHTIPVKFDLEIDNKYNTIKLTFVTEYSQKLKMDYAQWITTNLNKNNIKISSCNPNIEKKLILGFKYEESK